MKTVLKSSRLFKEEIFAPVLTLHQFDDLSLVTTEINDMQYGLQHSVFTNDMPTIFALYNSLDAGSIIFNNIPSLRYDHMPYGGIKKSGNTKEGVSSAFKEFTFEKCCLLDYSNEFCK